MDPHAVNAMGMQGGMSMPMSMAMAGANGANPQAMAMGMNGMAMSAYGVQQQQQQQQQQQMMMNMNQMNQMNMGSMAMKMNPNAMNPAAAAAGAPGMQVAGTQAAGVAGADWRMQLTREHRANLIAKIYNEMVRVSADPVPGIKLWMNVSWYELTLYKESRTQEEYINKIFTRLKSLRAQQTDMNAVMAAQTLPNQGMLSRLDFSYYNTLNLNQRAAAPGANGAQVGGYPGHPQFGGPSGHPGAQQPQQGKPVAMGTAAMPTNPAAPNGANTTPQAAKPDGAAPGDMTAEYWRQHAALKAKYHDDVEKVHSAFKKYVDHMKGHDETEQKKKLRYLLSYVQLCASILNEDKTTHAPRKIEELDKVYKYIVKIVNPYLKKLRTETDKRSFTPNAGSVNGANPAGVNPSASANPAANGPSASAGAAPVNSSAMHMQQQQQPGPNQQQQAQQQQQNPANAPGQNLSLQQKQQQYLMQQRAQQMQQQQQRMQAQARMDSSGLLQMPSNLGSSGTSSGFMSFSNDLSPTNFSSMDLLDMDGFMGQDGGSNSGGSGQNNSNSSGGNNTNSGDGGDSDLMFMEAL
ncbi:hypothetical protein PF008_g11551 [Phytophthora fragariae]|uniref:Mediator complex subunit 15 KIX domain-containing protein n=1 Tax=Phytophthora fragariae TaxID=53985 RepID=A0A6G0RS13_9STRA|nr:hypothetical protein PF008_g11551 [Phytophthora fragariae]